MYKLFILAFAFFLGSTATTFAFDSKFILSLAKANVDELSKTMTKEKFLVKSVPGSKAITAAKKDVTFVKSTGDSDSSRNQGYTLALMYSSLSKDRIDAFFDERKKAKPNPDFAYQRKDPPAPKLGWFRAMIYMKKHRRVHSLLKFETVGRFCGEISL